MPQQQFDKNTAITTAIVGLVIFFAIAYFGYSAMTQDLSSSPVVEEKQSVEEMMEENEAKFKATATNCAKEKILSSLKSPSTAEFPFTLTTYRDGGYWIVNSYVDAQNSFGATLRTNFSCKILGTNWKTGICESIECETW